MSNDKNGELKFNEQFVTELGKFCSEDIVEINGQCTQIQFVGVTSNFDGLLQKVAELGYTFSIYRSNKNKGGVRFANKIGDLGINSSYLFKSGGSYYYHCAYGPRPPNRQKNDKKRENHKIGKRFHIRPSKKMDCKAIMNVRKIVLFPDYQLSEGKKSWRIKEKIRKDLKADARTEIWHVFKISLPSVHNHANRTSLLRPPVHFPVMDEFSVFHTSYDSSNEEVVNWEVLKQLQDNGNNIVHDGDNSKQKPFTEAAKVRQICKKIIDLTYNTEGMCGDSTQGTKAMENLLDAYNGFSKAYCSAQNGLPLSSTSAM